MSDSSHRAGFVTLLGKPNAGKSTLLNRLLGQKLSIITPKAQTTRHRIFGIENGEGYQVIYSDTPGVIRPRYRLQEHMMRFVGTAMEDADLILLLLSAVETFPEEDLLERAGASQAPKLWVVNKCDIASPEQVERRMAEAAAHGELAGAFAISALGGQGIEALHEAILRLLPESPPYFDKDQISDRPERFFVAEIIREKLFLLLQEELPYATEVEVLKFEEGEHLSRIYADIHVERQSQKGMVIGKGGTMLRLIGQAARKEIEAFLGQQVYLELYVRVSENWKDNAARLRNFGYEG
jgi:GTP-binding protein Era